MRTTRAAAILVVLAASCGGDEPVGSPGANATLVPIPTTAPPPTASPRTTPVTTDAAREEPMTTTSSTDPTEPTDPTTTSTTAPSSAPTTPAGAQTPLVEQALADLRIRLGDPAAEIEIVSVDEVDWPDGSIGCPQPGMVYTQAIVNGSKIVLRHAGVEYPYHQGGRRQLFLCEQAPSNSKTPLPPITIDPDV